MPPNVSVGCDEVPGLPADGVVTAADACGAALVLNVSELPDVASACPGNYTIIRTWTATDECNNTVSRTQFVEVRAKSPPVCGDRCREAVANATMQVLECGAVAPLPLELPFEDPCDPEPIVANLTHRELVRSETTCEIYLVETYGAKSMCGLTGTVRVNRTIRDRDAPHPEPQPAPFRAHPCDDVPAVPIVTAVDTCFIGSEAERNFSVEGAMTTPLDDCGFVFGIVWEMTDWCGNTRLETQNITLVDIDAPEIFVTGTLPVENAAVVDVQAACNDASTATPQDCNASVVYSIDCWDLDDALAWTPVIADNCANDDVQVYESEIEHSGLQGLPCEVVGLRLLNFTAVDCAGQATTEVVSLRVIDNGSLVLAGDPFENSTLECGADGGMPRREPCNEPEFATPCNDTRVPGACNAAVTNTTCFGNYTVRQELVSEPATCGRVTRFERFIEVVDTTPPKLAWRNPSDGVTVAKECESRNVSAIISLMPPASAVQAMDACEGEVGATEMQDTFDACNGTCLDGCSVTRTFTAVDSCGNENTEFVGKTVTLTDTTAPTLALDNATWPFPRANATSRCVVGAELNVAAVTVYAVPCERVEEALGWVPVASDACSDISAAGVEGGCAPRADDHALGGSNGCDDCAVYDCAFTVADVCGNPATLEYVLVSADTAGPNITLDVPAVSSVQCQSDLPEPANATCSDSCGNCTVRCPSEHAAGGAAVGNCGADGGPLTVVRTWVAVDACGNAASRARALVVHDTEAPVCDGACAGTLANTTFACTGPAAETAAREVAFSDNCNGTYVADRTAIAVMNDSANPCRVEVTETYAAEDACGNVGSFVAHLVLEDQEAPAFVEPDAGEGDAPWNVPAYATRAGGDAPWLTLCNERGSASQSGFLPECARPNASEAATFLVGCRDVAAFASNTSGWAPPFVHDACDANVRALLSERVAINVSSGCSVEAANGSRAVATWHLAYRAVDKCGLDSDAYGATVFVEDREAPQLVFDGGVAPEAFLSVPCDVELPEPVLFCRDDCDGDGPAIPLLPLIYDRECPGTYKVNFTWTCHDSCGRNGETLTQVIQVFDEVAPVIPPLIPDDTANCSARGALLDEVNALGLEDATTDNCNDVNGFTTSHLESLVTPGRCVPSEAVVVTATDACGNNATATVVRHFEDVATPTINATGLPANGTVLVHECGTPTPFDGDDWAANVTATDDCTDAVQVNCTVEGPTTDRMCVDGVALRRTFRCTARDDCGNDATPHVFHVHTIDTRAPNVTAPAPGMHEVECAADLPALAVPVCEDCADGPNVTCRGHRLHDAGAASECGTTFSYIYQAGKDACGNVATPLVYQVAVRDRTPPACGSKCEAVVSAPVDIQQCAGGGGTFPPPPPSVSFLDNCLGMVEAQAVALSTTEHGGSATCNTTVRLRAAAVDACGNEAEAVEFARHYIDTDPPVLEAAAGQTQALGCHPTAPPVVNATDGCFGDVSGDVGVVAVSGGDRAGECAYSVVWRATATDACGNEDSLDVTQTVLRDAKPLLEVMPAYAELNVLCNVTDFVGPNSTVVSATDACAAGTVTQPPTTSGPSTLRAGAYALRTYAAIDECGNIASKTQLLRLQSLSCASESGDALQPVPGRCACRCAAAGAVDASGFVARPASSDGVSSYHPSAVSLPGMPEWNTAVVTLSAPDTGVCAGAPDDAPPVCTLGASVGGEAWAVSPFVGPAGVVAFDVPAGEAGASDVAGIERYVFVRLGADVGGAQLDAGFAFREGVARATLGGNSSFALLRDPAAAAGLERYSVRFNASHVEWLVGDDVAAAVAVDGAGRTPHARPFVGIRADDGVLASARFAVLCVSGDDGLASGGGVAASTPPGCTPFSRSLNASVVYDEARATLSLRVQTELGSDDPRVLVGVVGSNDGINAFTGGYDTALATGGTVPESLDDSVALLSRTDVSQDSPWGATRPPWQVFATNEETGCGTDHAARTSLAALVLEASNVLDWFVDAADNTTVGVNGTLLAYTVVDQDTQLSIHSFSVRVALEAFDDGLPAASPKLEAAPELRVIDGRGYVVFGGLEPGLAPLDRAALAVDGGEAFAYPLDRSWSGTATFASSDGLRVETREAGILATPGDGVVVVEAPGDGTDDEGGDRDGGGEEGDGDAGSAAGISTFGLAAAAAGVALVAVLAVVAVARSRSRSHTLETGPFNSTGKEVVDADQAAVAPSDDSMRTVASAYEELYSSGVLAEAVPVDEPTFDGTSIVALSPQASPRGCAADREAEDVADEAAQPIGSGENPFAVF